MSERRAWRLVNQPRGTQRYHRTQREDEEALTRATTDLATQYGRYGYRRITALLKRDGPDRSCSSYLQVGAVFSRITPSPPNASLSPILPASYLYSYAVKIVGFGPDCCDEDRHLLPRLCIAPVLERFADSGHGLGPVAGVKARCI